ncbi:cache domain-containing protein [Sulfurimonas sp.]
MKIKHLLFVLIFFVIAMSVLLLYKHLETLKKQSIEKMVTKLLHDLNVQEMYSEDISFVVLTNISENKKIIQSLKEHNRTIAITELQRIIAEYKKKTNIENLKIHMHTADVKAFVRSWKLNKFGDDLSDFRATINKVKLTKEPVFAFEIGRIGLTLRSLLPIIDNGKYLGSIEFIQQFDQVPQKFEKRGTDYLLLMNKSYSNIAKYLKDAPVIQDYKVSSKYFHKNFVKEARKIDFKKMLHDKYLLTDKYLFAYKEIKDINDNSLGLHLMAMSGKNVHDIIAYDRESAITLYMILALGIFFFIFVIYFVSKK